MTKLIRILELIKDFGIEGGGGGASRFCVELSQRLDRSRFDVSVCSLWDMGTPFEHERIAQLKGQGIHAVASAHWNESSPYLGFLQAYRNLRAGLKAQTVTIIHSHSEFADIAALLLKTLPNRPTILRTIHNGFQVEWKNRPLRRWMFSYFFFPLNFEMEIGVSQNIVDNLNHRWLARLTGRKARRVNNGIDLQRFSHFESKAVKRGQVFGIPPGARVIGSIGRMAEEKGYHFLLEAFALVLNLHPETFLLLVGEGPLGTSLRRYADELGIASHVVFAGSQKNVDAVFASLDLFVSSSLWEGLSTVILESMASGTPIVATSIAGTREIIRDKVNGWLVPAANPSALANAIDEALENSTACEVFASRAKKDVGAFSIEAIVAEYEEIFTELGKR
jgi:glycosyltransferase involved in cell wall biosynthesis